MKLDTMLRRKMQNNHCPQNICVDYVELINVEIMTVRIRMTKRFRKFTKH
jgi:hypothetical protein